jgi:hypothetical protein
MSVKRLSRSSLRREPSPAAMKLKNDSGVRLRSGCCIDAVGTSTACKPPTSRWSVSSVDPQSQGSRAFTDTPLWHGQHSAPALRGHVRSCQPCSTATRRRGAQQSPAVAFLSSALSIEAFAPSPSSAAFPCTRSLNRLAWSTLSPTHAFLAHARDRVARAELHVRLPELDDDIFRRVKLPARGP